MRLELQADNGYARVVVDDARRARPRRRIPRVRAARRRRRLKRRFPQGSGFVSDNPSPPLPIDQMRLQLALRRLQLALRHGAPRERQMDEFSCSSY